MRRAAVALAVLLLAIQAAGCLARSDPTDEGTKPNADASTSPSNSELGNGTDGPSPADDPDGSEHDSTPEGSATTIHANFTHDPYASYTSLWDWHDVDLNLTAPYRAILVEANWTSEIATDEREAFRVLEENSSREIVATDAASPLRWRVDASDVGQGAYLLRIQVADESIPDRPAYVVVEREVHVAVTIFHGMGVPEGFSAWS